ncbi:MAG: hypothetical protein ACTHJT_05740 [Cytophaga sp.]|uniref:hypothetical protein n=1 Tax=Cytophaga sp. TaxID=29535 RepID=UPI003F8060C1
MIQLLLPLTYNEGQSFSEELFNAVEEDLTYHFGGVTSYIRTPAKGLWKETAKNTVHDEIILIEVMVNEVNNAFWTTYKVKLEQLFKQSEIIIRSSPIELL